MGRLRLSFACADYDRTRAFSTGAVTADGIEITPLIMPVEETFFRMLRYQEFDVAEMSLSSYVMSLFREDRPFIAIPVFTSRFFRHSSIYINADAGIISPADLIGKRIGCPEYQMTAPVWIRGIMADEFGVSCDAVTHVTGGEETPNRSEKLPLNLPDRISLKRIGEGQTLSRMLASGEIDALFTARRPSTYDPQGSVRRLFEDFYGVERSYYRKTLIFPIMHTIVLRRATYEANPWIAQSLYKAFLESQMRAYRLLDETAALSTMLPWLHAHVVDAVREMGPDFWPYGLEQNRHVLEVFLRYSHEQGLSPRLLDPDDLFTEETREAFVI